MYVCMYVCVCVCVYVTCITPTPPCIHPYPHTHTTDVDSILHVNPYLDNRGLAMVFNPTTQHISRNLTLPLYYTGITSKALLTQEGKEPGRVYTLDGDYSISVPLDMPGKSITWYLVRSAD